MTIDFVLPAGTVVKVNGRPVELVEDVTAATHPTNVPAVFGFSADDVAGPVPDAGYVSAPSDPGAVAEAFGLRRPLRDRLAQRLVDAAVERGADRAKAEQAVAEVASERPLLDWLFNGGFEKLLDLILKLITLI